MKIRMVASVTVALAVALSALPALATQTGGLAWPAGQGGFATSLTVGFSEERLKGGDAESASSFRNLLRAEVGLFEDLDLYGTAGISDLDLKGGEFEESRGGSFALGARYSLVKSADGSLRLVMNAEAEYFKISLVQRQAYSAGVYVIQRYGAAGTVGYFFPYGGARVSVSRYNGKDDVEDHKGKNLIGLFGGADYFVTPNVYFSGEIHLFDEMSVYLTTGYRF